MIIDLPCIKDRCLLLPLCKNKRVIRCNKILEFLETKNKRNKITKKIYKWIIKRICTTFPNTIYLTVEENSQVEYRQLYKIDVENKNILQFYNDI